MAAVHSVHKLKKKKKEEEEEEEENKKKKNAEVKNEWSYAATPSRALMMRKGATGPLLNAGTQRLKLMIFIVKVPVPIIMTEDYQCFLQYFYLNAVSAP